MIFENGFGAGPTISAGAETTLSAPSGLLALPDEHSSFVPPSSLNSSYLFFEAAKAPSGAGAIVLQPTNVNMTSFGYATGYVSPVNGLPKPFGQCASSTDPPSLDGEFDENYAGPGSVVQDPTLPAGNLIMVYEGENHCRGPQGSATNVFPYFATVGFARSSDNGKTWPGPSILPPPNPQRYPIVGGPDAKPSNPSNPTAIGDAIPSAYVEGTCLYVVYNHHPAPGGSGHPAAIQIARAQLGGADPLTFQKYLTPGFTSPGLTGSGTDVVPFIPVGASSSTPICTGPQYHAGLSYNDTLQRYLLTFVCEVSSIQGQLAWFFSMATSLDAQNWTPPQIIQGTQAATTSACSSLGYGTSFDGWYPSFYSLGSVSGHTGPTAVAFYLSGCDAGVRMFASRPLTVVPDAN